MCFLCILGPCGQCQFQFHSKFLAIEFSILGPCGQCQFQFHSKFLIIGFQVTSTGDYRICIFYFGTLWPMSIPISLQILLLNFSILGPCGQCQFQFHSKFLAIEFSILGPCGQCQFQFHSKFLTIEFSILGPCGQCQFQFHSKFLTIGFQVTSTGDYRICVFYFGTLWPMSIPISLQILNYFSILGPCGQCQFQFHSKFLGPGQC